MTLRSFALAGILASAVAALVAGIDAARLQSPASGRSRSRPWQRELEEPASNLPDAGLSNPGPNALGPFLPAPTYPAVVQLMKDPAQALAALDSIPYGETRQYVREVLANYAMYRRLYGAR